MLCTSSDDLDVLNDDSSLRRIQSLVERFWSHNALPDEDSLTSSFDDDYANKQLASKCKILPTKRIQLPCLWKPGEPNFDSNFDYAKKRLDSLMSSKAFRNPDMMKAYTDLFHKWMDSKIITQVVDDLPRRKGTYYWAHFPVIRKDSSSTPIRPVFDGAAKVNGHCINDYIMQGPMLLNDIQDVLLRFRRYDFAIAGDVSEMFLMIELPETDRPYHRFLWYENGHLVIYQFNRHLFGNTGSPCVAVFAIRHLADQYKLQAPEAHDTVHHSSVIDDMVDSRQTVDQAVALVKQLLFIFPKIGMTIRKFYSNSPDVMDTIPKEMRLQKVNEWNDVLSGKEPVPTLKTLGVKWNVFSDKLYYDFDIPSITPAKKPWTKLSMLAFAHSLFDPFGHLAPATFYSKLALQQCWRLGLDWKTDVPLEILTPWTRWVSTLHDLSQISLTRVLFPGIDSMHSAKELHVFTDASKEAYAAAAYARTVFKDGRISTNLIMCRSKVAPIKTSYTIPRMELLGMELGATLITRISTTFSIPASDVFLWTDSTTCIDWMSVTTRCLQVFVKNRVTKVLNALLPQNIRWVPGDLNPADLPTRGLTPAQLALSTTWFQGPDFLREDSSTWPERPKIPTHIEPDNPAYEEIRSEDKRVISRELKAQGVHTDSPPIPILAAVKVSPYALRDNFIRQDDDSIPFVDDTSDWDKIRRITATLFQFVRWLKTGKQTVLSRSEAFNIAELALAHYSQQASFRQTIHQLQREGAVTLKNPLRKYRPYLVQGDSLPQVIRLSGRQHFAHVHSQCRFPVLLSADDPYTLKLIRWMHQVKLAHIGGRNTLISIVSSRYFVPRLTKLVRKTIETCVICKRRDAVPHQQIMGPMPDFRIPTGQRVVPFTVTVMDTAGPFETKGGRGRLKQKRWLLILSCTHTKAVHIELLDGLSTDQLVLALESFSSIRARPRIIYCDNQTSYQRLGLELAELHGHEEETDFRKIESKTSIQVRFGPPDSPHFQGLAEAMVKQVKRALHTTLQTPLPSDMEFRAAAAKIMGMLNNVPISYTVKNGSDLDVEPITPNHFLLGGHAYEEVIKDIDSDSSYLVRNNQLNALLDRFWKRLVNECGLELVKYQKWSQQQKNICVGDIGVLLDKKNSRGHYPLARVTAIVPSADDNVRRITVFDGNKYYSRSNRNFAILVPCS